MVLSFGPPYGFLRGVVVKSVLVSMTVPVSDLTWSLGFTVRAFAWHTGLFITLQDVPLKGMLLFQHPQCGKAGRGSKHDDGDATCTFLRDSSSTNPTILGVLLARIQLHSVL